LGAVAIGALYGMGWLALAPNRLLPGQPIPAVQALGGTAHLIAVLVVASALGGRRPAGRVLALALVGAAIAAALIGTGLGAGTLMAGRPPAARVALGAGFWLCLSALTALAIDHARHAGARGGPVLVAAGLLGFVAIGFAAGLFDDLSLAVEYRTRLAQVNAAFRQHIVLALGALALALAVALPLGWAAFRSPRVEAVANAVLGVVQVTPAIALFGLLVPLIAGLLGLAPALREIGIRAIGPTPALVGVAIYLALPLLRGLLAGLKSTDPAIVETAQAMGMSPARTIMEVRIPLGLPILFGALRLAAVQSIALMTLGGLIGAGGLGAIVFEGMSQLAADLILLGAIPIVGLALAVDWGMVAASRMLKGLH
jgi:osmoprotectant transport system permease protein